MPQVRVPQEDGEVRIAVDGAPARSWEVVDHVVTTRSHADADLVVLHVDGATTDPDPDPKAKAGARAGGRA